MTAGPGTIWQKQPAADGIGPPQWVQVGNIVGPSGPQGKQGTQGQAAFAGQGGAVLPLKDQEFADFAASSNITTTSGSFVNVTGFSFPVQPNEIWTCEAYCFLQTQNSGVKFQWTGPGSPTVVRIINQGALAGEGGIQTDSQNAFSSASATYAAGNGASNFTVFKVNLTIINGANPGIVQWQFEAGTGGDSTQVLTGSYMAARRIA